MHKYITEKKLPRVLIKCDLSRKRTLTDICQKGQNERQTDWKRMFKPFETVLNTVQTAKEKLQMDAVNVRMAKENFEQMIPAV